jgi:hypothetical protein
MEINNIAFLDGIVEFISYLTRIFAGVISDSINNRKLFLLIGSTVTLMMKPVFSIVSKRVPSFCCAIG